MISFVSSTSEPPVYGTLSDCHSFANSRLLDQNTYCINSPNVTSFIRIIGNSMKNMTLPSSNQMVVDMAETPWHGDMIIVETDIEFAVPSYSLSPA
ncbi:S24 family peptidase [Enterobacter ludwigii]|uniref:S24 family peptidase n=1 Tax=Enterobacter ludwigii TaxID=299767 RepID=UPI002FFC10E2